MITLASFMIAFAGFTFIALTQNKPRKILCGGAGQGQSQKRWYRLIATTLLLLSLILIISNEGWSFGSIMWGTLITIAAMTVSMGLTFFTAPFRKLVRVTKL
ncbi:MAG: DUF3325 family protein [Gammaproteobacteria bacterium]|nr:DUF3325 family protein [Gammaproteobacteria bacterium]MCY4357528.1 DUF3325 family protein [Gammaproteobacteria bacterium]